MKLMAIENYDDEVIFGFVDEGTTCSRFVSEKGKDPQIIRNAAFKKKNYKSVDEFIAIMGKFLPAYYFLDKPITVDSIKYDDLIDIVSEKFPSLKTVEEPAVEDAVSSNKTSTSRQTPIPDDDIDEEGDVDYSVM